jgi:hypothetical protein
MSMETHRHAGRITPTTVVPPNQTRTDRRRVSSHHDRHQNAATGTAATKTTAAIASPIPDNACPDATPRRGHQTTPQIHGTAHMKGTRRRRRLGGFICASMLSAPGRSNDPAVQERTPRSLKRTTAARSRGRRARGVTACTHLRMGRRGVGFCNGLLDSSHRRPGSSVTPRVGRDRGTAGLVCIA